MKKIIILLAAVFLLAACGQNETKQENSGESTEVHPLEVNLKVPDHANIHEKVSLTAEVSYGGEAVEDADEVKFEIWKEGEKEESKMIEAKHEKDGQYTIEHTFDENGVFFVQSHVTAKNQHNMPKKQIVIGELHKDGASTGENEETANHTHEHSKGSVDIQLELPENVKANAETLIQTKIQAENAPLLNANVRYEIWKDGSEKHDWVDTAEKGKGTYEAKYTFSDPGTYQIQVHVNNDEGLHEHVTKKVTVQK
ncbi:FixH family protein [Aeribacillus pallidus]|nr:FixH family protein [Aeribacillus pallidus]